MALQHLRSSTANKRPVPSGMADGQLAINSNLASPGLFLKDSNGDLVKVGPVHIGTTAPNVSPASGGQAGNSKGEQWLDTASSRYVFKVWDGTAWRTQDGEFVNVTGDTMTGALVMDNQQQVQFRETTANGTNYIALQATASVASDKIITLPDITGTVVTTGDTGSVTSTMILNGTIVDADINASAAIVDTKLATIATAGKVSNSATTATSSSTVSTIVARDSSGNFAAGTITATLAGNASTVTTNANLTGDITSSGNATSIANGVIVNDDVNASAAIAGSKISPNFGSQTVQTTGIFSAAAGTAAAPSVAFTGDIDTGLYSPGVNQAAISTAGSERLRITSTGLVGVGTSSPGALLTVGTNSPIIELNDGDSAADNKRWQFFTGATSLGIRAVTDAGAGGGNTFIFNRAAEQVQSFQGFKDGAAWFHVDNSTARVGIGTASPGSALEINAAAATSPFIAKINTAEAARIDSSGRLLVGASTARGNFFNAATSSIFHVEGAVGAPGRITSQVFGAANVNGPIHVLAKHRGAAVGGTDVINDADQLGTISFQGSDGTEFVEGATIAAFVDGTPGANDMPGRLVFSTTADGASSSTERMRITSAGVLQVADAGNITVGTTTGTKIGTATTQKLGFYNATPVVQPTAVANATDAASVITQLNALLAKLRTLGIIAT